jgi:hypothetical protein
MMRIWTATGRIDMEVAAGRMKNLRWHGVRDSLQERRAFLVSIHPFSYVRSKAYKIDNNINGLQKG